MRIKLLAAAALLAASFAPAAAQRAAPPPPVTVEIVATGTIETQPSWYTVGVSYTVTGEDDAAVKKARADKQDAIRALLKKGGLPESALTLDPPNEPTSVPTGVDDVTVTSMESDDKASAKGKKAGPAAPAPDSAPTETMNLADAGTIKVTTLQQATWLRDSLMTMDVMGAEPQGELADPEGARRQAKTKALVAARADADAYAAALGLHAVRLARISEQGNGMFFPGLQAKIQQAMAGGPGAMMRMFKNPSGVVRVDETIVVEFELTP